MKIELYSDADDTNMNIAVAHALTKLDCISIDGLREIADYLYVFCRYEDRRKESLK